jgi:hypothetical protein
MLPAARIAVSIVHSFAVKAGSPVLESVQLLNLDQVMLPLNRAGPDLNFSRAKRIVITSHRGMESVAAEAWSNAREAAPAI